MISFREDSAENIVDDWLGPSSVPKSGHALPSVDLSRTNQRLGLGFQGSKKHTSNNNLAAKKDNKRARKNEVAGDLHGVIEEDVEDSKLSAVVKKPKHHDFHKNNTQNPKQPSKASFVGMGAPSINPNVTNPKTIVDNSNTQYDMNTHSPTVTPSTETNHTKPTKPQFPQTSPPAVSSHTPTFTPTPAHTTSDQAHKPSQPHGGRGGRGEGGR
ncbi:hypothetical protein EON65_41680, partial [archaeon]